MLVLTSSAGLHAAPVDLFNQNFDGLNGGNGQNNFPFGVGTGFTVSNGTVDLVGNGFDDFLPGNGLYVDLDGSTNDAGRMQSDTLTLNPGSYVLTFDLAGSQRNITTPTDSVTVTFDAFPSETFTRTFSDPFQTITRNFTINAATTGSLIFEDVAGADSFGLLLDNVRLSFDAGAAAVPEPTSLALWGIGGLGLSYFQMRRRRRAQLAVATK